VARHLAAQQGRRHRVLMEAPDMGRTEQFTEVRFAAPQPVGQIVEAVITGASGAQLTA
jgi:threonylcarbamoyladenosine tRNA methylthiotransferase MtaB